MKNEEMQKEKSNNSPFEKLSSETIWNILLFLPTKACLNCKLVCKRWYAIISSPEFAGQRRACGRYISLLFNGRSRFDPKFMLVDLDTSAKQHHDRRLYLIISDDAKIVFKPKLRHRTAKLKLVNECNGLLCFKTEACWSSFMICNFLTGQQVTVKQPYRVGYRPVSCGWGYSPVSQQYKILRILRRPRPRPSDDNSCVAEIHTLGTHEWRCVDNNAPGELSYQFNAFLNGSLHGCCHSSNCIWSFNFDTEQFSLVPLSHEIMYAGVILAVSIFESSLCCTTSNVDSDIPYMDAVSQVWIMKEYGNKDSWVNLFVSLPFYNSVPLFRPMNGGYMLVSFVGRELDTLYYDNDVFGVYFYGTRGYYVLRVLKMPMYVLACDTMFSQLPMKLMQEQRDPKSLL